MGKHPLTHIAIIPDGNRRWATKHKLRPWVGHQKGMALLREMAVVSVNYGVKYITFWTGSVDNLTKRNKVEVRYLIKYIGDVLSDPETLKIIQKNNIRVRVLGRWKEIIKQITFHEAVAKLEYLSKNNTKARLNILLGYDGQDEMLTAVNRVSEGKKYITAEKLKKSLWTGYLPPVDLVIRTGGEPHWSAGFMMWLTANSQLYFTETLWPDFDSKELRKAFAEYERRERRLGK